MYLGSSIQQAVHLLVLTVILVSAHGLHQKYSDPKTVAASRLEDTDVESYYLDDGMTLMVKRDPVRGTMWFGPRLGRRRRSADENLAHEKNEENLMKLLEDTPWTLIALKGGRRRTLNFTPRLGRDSNEDFGDNMVDGFKIPSRSGGQTVTGGYLGNNFTPRLGRFAEQH